MAAFRGFMILTKRLRMRTVVVDLNLLQDPSLATQIKADSNFRFVIPDVALVEMCKHENCHLTMKLALKVFAANTERVVVARSVGETLNMELDSLSPITTDRLLSHDFTTITRQLIIDLVRDDRNTKETIQGRFGAARIGLLKQDLNAIAAKGRTERLLEILRKGLTPQIIGAIRKPTLDCTRLLSFVQVMAEIFLLQMLRKDFGMSEQDARYLITQRPMYLRYYYVLALHCLMTIRMGGDISGMKAEKELNHHLDLDYVLIASYFNDLLSRDNRMKEVYLNLRTILATSSDEALERLDEWFLEVGVEVRG
jgi:hypothetical protein